MDRRPFVRCSGCGEHLAERWDLAPEQRRPCESCGSLSRTFEVGLVATSTITASPLAGPSAIVAASDITASPSTATLALGGGTPSVQIEEVGVFTRLQEWTSLPGGAWMLRVYDARGEVVDGGLGYDVEDGYFDVSDSMLPPE